jgi:predicted aldo/keto reductase-like oxidoreductase
MSTSRRDFLAASAAALAAAGLSSPAHAQAAPAASPILDLPTPESTRKGDMLYRPLGKTGETVSLIGLGGYHAAVPGDNGSLKLIRRAIDSGITFMDNCWDYHDGKAEERMGRALQDGYRQKVFLMTKLDGRTKDSANKQLEDSLKRLQTDHIDLVQIHENIRMEDADNVFAKGGAIEALTAAKQAGKLRFIGFTGHKDPSIHLHMLDVAKKNNFHFDTCQMPLNVMDAHFRSFAHLVVPELLKQGVAPLAMKTLGGGMITGAKGVSPIDCIQYAMNLPTATVICGIDSDKILDQALEAVKTFKPFTKEQLAAILDKTKELASKGDYEKFKTSTMFDGTAHNPKWLGLAS